VVDAVSSAGDRPAAERIAAAVEAFARRALAGPVLAYAQIAEPVDPAVEAERLTLRRGYRDVFARALEEGVTAGELPPHDTQIYAAALVGALGEALVGPLSPSSTANGGPGVDVREAGLRGGRRHHEALVATLVQFCLDAIPKEVTRARSRTAA
jgi:AcrR family transcriptional regulator